MVGDAALHRLLGIEGPETDIHQRGRAHDMGRGALHHGHVGVVLPQSRGDVVGRVVRADDHRLLAAIGVRPGMFGGMVLVALEPLHAGEFRQVRLGRHAGGQHQMLRAQNDLLAVALDDDLPFLLPGVEARLLAGGRAPIVQLHHLHIHLQPVADLVLGREHRPVGREGQVRHVVVPDRVVQAERLVAVAPAVAGPRVLLDDDGRHAEHPQPRAEADAALPAADDHHIGLLGVAERSRLFLPVFLPGRTILGGAVLGAERPLEAERLLVALQLDGGGQKRPDFSLFQSHVAVAAKDVRLEREPAGHDAAVFGGPARRVEREGRGFCRGELRFQHGADRRLALHGLDVPGEGNQVAPVAIVLEEIDRRVDLAAASALPNLVKTLLTRPSGVTSSMGFLPTFEDWLVDAPAPEGDCYREASPPGKSRWSAAGEAALLWPALKSPKCSAARPFSIAPPML